MNELTFGQWIGSAISEKNEEMRVMLNIERRSPGLAQVLSHSARFPQFRLCTTAPFRRTGNHVVIESPDTRVFENGTGTLIPIKEYYARNKIDAPVVNRITYSIQQWGAELIGLFENDVGEKGRFHLRNTVHVPPPGRDRKKTRHSSPVRNLSILEMSSC